MWRALWFVLHLTAAQLHKTEKVVCGGSSSGQEFRVESPIRELERCDYLVEAASDSVCGLSLDIGPRAMPPCPSEHLIVAGRNLCGHHGLVQVPFQQPQALITLKGTTGGDNVFNMTVRQTECSDRTTASQSQCSWRTSGDEIVVQSPGYPAKYPGGLDCRYIIRPSEPGVCQLEVTFQDSALERSPNCSKDWLEIAEDRMCGELSGVRTYDFVDGDGLPVRFRTDSEGSERGFFMTAKQVHCSDTAGIVTNRPQGNDKQDTFDCEPPVPPALLTHNNQVLQGYPSFKQPFPPFSSTRENLPSGGYLPPDHVVNPHIPIETDPPLLPPFRENPLNNPSLGLSCDNAFQGQNDGLGNDNVRSVRPTGNQIPHIPERGFPRGYLPPDSFSNQEIPLEQVPPHFTPSRQFPPINQYPKNPCEINSQGQNCRSLQNNPFPGTWRPDLRVPVQQRPLPFQPHFSNRPPRLPERPNTFTTPVRPGAVYSQYQQCCSLTYSDSHFLLASPGFPKSQSADCVYTISRFSDLTYQLRFQFRYFWVGEDTGTGCSGGYLEIDGTRICGCKTGVVWTSSFSASESSKTLHLRLSSSVGKVFSGFVIEVYQDDSYSQNSYYQRYKRVSDLGPGIPVSKNITGGVIANFSQFVETVVDRRPALVSDRDLRLQDPLEQRVWDSSRQAWTLPSNVFCLRWNLQDWIYLAEEALWVRYQCPTSTSSFASSSVAGSVLSQSAACQTCRYFCRQNCNCC